MRLIRSNLRRLVQRPATLITFLLLGGLMVLLMLALAAAATQAPDPQSTLASRLILTFPGAWLLTLSMTVAFGGLLGLTYGAAIAGSEWAWGTLKAAVARGERRAWYAVAGILGAVVIAWAGTLIAYAAGVVGALVAAGVADVPHATIIDAATLGDLPGQLGRAALVIAMDVAIGFAVATIARSQLAGIGAGIGLYLGEGVIGLFLPGIVKWAAFAAGSSVMAGSQQGLAGAAASVSAPRLDPDVAILVVAAWFLVATAVAALWTERADIGG